ncbi:MAG: ABC transporter permease, partial [Pseudomonadales bacterium]|nr:ABC transporter permease [Pseudomonadales bacterium]
ILSVTGCFVFVIIGFPMVLNSFYGWAPEWLLDSISQLSFITHFDAISRGVLDIRDLLFYLFFIVVWLLATSVVIEIKKAG